MSTGLAIASTLLAGLGSFAVVAAVVYSSRQTRALQAQLELEGRNSLQAIRAQRAANDVHLLGHVLSVDRLFIERPDLRRFFYEDAPVPSEGVDRARVLATAEMIIDVADAVASMMRHDQLAPDNVAAWEAAIRQWGQSPAVREILDQDRGVGAWDAHTVSLLRGEKAAVPRPAPLDAV